MTVFIFIYFYAANDNALNNMPIKIQKIEYATFEKVLHCADPVESLPLQITVKGGPRESIFVQGSAQMIRSSFVMHR